VNLTQWAKVQGICPPTGYRWLREGTLAVPVVRVTSRSILVAPEAVRSGNSPGGVGLYALVSSHDQRADRIPPGIQAAQDRSGSPTEQDSLLLSG